MRTEVVALHRWAQEADARMLECGSTLGLDEADGDLVSPTFSGTRRARLGLI
jgi:hypothetical protein